VKTPLTVSDAPSAIGPYVQAQVVRLHGGNRMVFTSGQVGLDPASGQLKGTTTAEQAEQVFKNLSAVLRGAGLGLDDVVKTTVYLADMNDFAAMNEVYGEYFAEPYPARATVQVARLPKDARVEIDVIAVYE
jgi:2-iminobutanoate/2-iminopropanoate deaminase